MTNFSTIQQAKDYVKQHINEGVECPCCTQFVKMYRRKITSSMAYALILIANSGKRDYFHVEDYLKGENCPAAIRGDFPKLRYWGLIEAEESKREDGSKRNGYYKITQKGIDFVQCKIVVPEAMYIFKNKAYNRPMENDSYISIKQALRGKFNYTELMTDQMVLI